MSLQNRNVLPHGPETRKKMRKTCERYLCRLCIVNVSYAHGDSPRRLLVDADYLHVTPDSLGPLCTHSTSFRERRGERVVCNRVSAAGGAAEWAWIWISPRYSPATMEEINYVSFCILPRWI